MLASFFLVFSIFRIRFKYKVITYFRPIDKRNNGIFPYNDTTFVSARYSTASSRYSINFPELLMPPSKMRGNDKTRLYSTGMRHLSETIKHNYFSLITHSSVCGVGTAGIKRFTV